MRDNRFNIQSLEDHLVYGGLSVDEAINDLYGPGMKQSDLTEEESKTLFSRIFMCPVCGAWLYASEKVELVNENQDVCKDCFNNDNDEEDED